MQPEQRIRTYFTACGHGSAEDIAAHFTPSAIIYDTNIRPISGAQQIGAMWVKVRDRWGGATWHVDSFVGDSTGAAIEWHMNGTDPDSGRQFVFRGSEHYSFQSLPDLDENRIAQIRQYWTFDPQKLDTGLRHYPYDPK